MRRRLVGGRSPLRGTDRVRFSEDASGHINGQPHPSAPRALDPGKGVARKLRHTGRVPPSCTALARGQPLSLVPVTSDLSRRSRPQHRGRLSSAAPSPDADPRVQRPVQKLSARGLFQSSSRREGQLDLPRFVVSRGGRSAARARADPPQSRCASIRRAPTTCTWSVDLAMGHSLPCATSPPEGLEVLSYADATICAVIAPRAVVAAVAEGDAVPDRADPQTRKRGRECKIARSSPHSDDGSASLSDPSSLPRRRPMNVLLGLVNPGKSTAARHNVAGADRHLAERLELRRLKKDVRQRSRRSFVGMKRRCA